MSAITEQPPQAPDAGVIEEARTRQRRQRSFVGAAAVAAIALTALLVAFTGGDGGSRPRSTAHRASGSPAAGTRSASASCLSIRRQLQGKPSRSLLSILGVLRRPALADDALPRRVAEGGGLTRDVFAKFIRRTQVIAGSPYYLFPAIVGGCRVEPEHQGIMLYESNIDLGHGLIGATGGGGATAADIESGRTLSTGPPGSSTSTTLTMITPDGVAEITLKIPAGRASGYSPKISPAATVTARPINNEVVVGIPRSNLPEPGSARGFQMIWRAANGHVIKRFARI